MSRTISIGPVRLFRRLAGAGVFAHWRDRHYRDQVGLFLPGGWGVVVLLHKRRTSGFRHCPPWHCCVRRSA